MEKDVLSAGRDAEIDLGAGAHVDREVDGLLGLVVFASDFAVDDPALARLLEDDGLLAKLPSAVASLLPRQRRLINQVFVERKTYVAIAREDGVDESAVRKSVGRALKKLKKLLM